MFRIKTVLYRDIFSLDECTAMFEYLKENIIWEDGISSKRSKLLDDFGRKGFTRKAKSLAIDDDQVIYTVVQKIITSLKHDYVKNIHQIAGVYLNYQRNGNEYTPMHSHKGSLQIVLSLGATRDFIVGQTTYSMKSGDVLIFGASAHGVPPQPEIIGSRISIATFAIPINC